MTAQRSPSGARSSRDDATCAPARRPSTAQDTQAHRRDPLTLLTRDRDAAGNTPQTTAQSGLAGQSDRVYSSQRQTR
jgi:hypothetical protein